MWHNGLRIQHCHSSGSGSRFGPWPRNFYRAQVQQKKKKKKKKSLLKIGRLSDRVGRPSYRETCHDRIGLCTTGCIHLSAVFSNNTILEPKMNGMHQRTAPAQEFLTEIQSPIKDPRMGDSRLINYQVLL